MKPASTRTTLSYHARAIGRALLTWWYERQADLEAWWRRHVVAKEPGGLVFGAPWLGASGPLYRDGRADIHVTEGKVQEMVDAYLHNVHTRPPQEVRTWKP